MFNPKTDFEKENLLTPGSAISSQKLASLGVVELELWWSGLLRIATHFDLTYLKLSSVRKKLLGGKLTSEEEILTFCRVEFAGKY